MVLSTSVVLTPQHTSSGGMEPRVKPMTVTLDKLQQVTEREQAIEAERAARAMEKRAKREEKLEAMEASKRAFEINRQKYVKLVFPISLPTALKTVSSMSRCLILVPNLRQYVYKPSPLCITFVVAM